jgi:RNA polymerase sigma-70 factor (ECF subfamily)
LGEQALVAAAAGGSEDAYRQLVEPIRSDLHAFCYRMLGSFHDAEDVLQEAQIKAWRGLDKFDGRSSFRTWIFGITTNAAIDSVRSKRRRVLPQELGPAREPGLGLGHQDDNIPWLDPYPDPVSSDSDPVWRVEMRESVRLAFVRALQLLPARQRAVLILRDVFDWSAIEVASALGSSVAAINSALQRARATVGSARPQHSRGSATDGKRAQMVERYVRAWEAGDIDEVVSMLTSDATHAMPPWNAWFVGREALRTVYSSYDIWSGSPGPGLFRIMPLALNSALGFAEYCRSERKGPFKALALTVVELNAEGSLINAKVSFVRPDLFGVMELPESVD